MLCHQQLYHILCSGVGYGVRTESFSSGLTNCGSTIFFVWNYLSSLSVKTKKYFFKNEDCKYEVDYKIWKYFTC